MRLDYGTQLSPCPISLSIGTIRKPTLKDIATISFEKFNFFEVFTKISPNTYYDKIAINKDYWNSLSDVEKESVTMYSIIKNVESVLNIYLDMLNFFFEEKVIFKEGFFIILKENADENNLKITTAQAQKLRAVYGTITRDNVMEIIKGKPKKKEDKFTGRLTKNIFKKYKDKFANDKEFSELIDILLENHYKDLSDKRRTN